MKKTAYILILIGFLISCKNSSNTDREKYCNDLKELALKEINKGNVEPVIKGKYLYSKTEKYFIWKKYNVNIIYPIDLHEIYQKELDSCYNSIMLANTPNTNGITKDLDSLFIGKQERAKYEYPKSKYISEYHDGKFYVGLDANNKDFAPKRVDTTYYDKLNKFQAQFTTEITDTIKCEFWYEIDTLGHVNNIEIYHHATPLIDSAVIEFYSSFKYIPANAGVIKLDFRDNDNIYFLGTKKK